MSKKKKYVLGTIAIVLALCCGFGAIASILPSETSDMPTVVPTISPTVVSTAVRPRPPTVVPTDMPTIAPTARPTVAPTVAPESTPVLMLIEPGTHIVGENIEPGIYVGLSSWCYWERLSGLTGEFDDILANDNEDGLFYVEILPTDVAFRVSCAMDALNEDVIRDELWTSLLPGTYLVGRDIGPGIYRGDAQADSCYWERLSGVTGEFDDILANSNSTGQFFIEVLPSDFALHTACLVEMIE